MDLTGERGCRVHFKTKYEVEELLDVFAAGAFDEDTGSQLREFDDVSPAYPRKFEAEEASISELDGRDDVHRVSASSPTRRSRWTAHTSTTCV